MKFLAFSLFVVLALSGCDNKSSNSSPGPSGSQGQQGEKGEKGDKGDPGVQGEKGDPGIQGSRGDKGDPGVQGDKGDKGDAGIQGPKGDKGDEGPSLIAGKEISSSTPENGNVLSFDGILGKWKSKPPAGSGGLKLIDENGVVPVVVTLASKSLIIKYSDGKSAYLYNGIPFGVFYSTSGSDYNFNLKAGCYFTSSNCSGDCYISLNSSETMLPSSVLPKGNNSYAAFNGTEPDLGSMSFNSFYNGFSKICLETTVNSVITQKPAIQTYTPPVTIVPPVKLDVN